MHVQSAFANNKNVTFLICNKFNKLKIQHYQHLQLDNVRTVIGQFVHSDLRNSLDKSTSKPS